jgi:hypothetical protein
MSRRRAVLTTEVNNIVAGRETAKAGLDRAASTMTDRRRCTTRF